MRPRSLVLLLALAVAAGSSARADVLVTGDRVSVSVQSMPANAVLDRLAKATGMAVTYEGGTPRTPVTIERASLSHAEAVLAVLEGLGLNYAMIMDPAGSKVETLVVLAGTRAATSAAASPLPKRGAAPAEDPEEHQEIPPEDTAEPPASAVDHPEDQAAEGAPPEKPADGRPVPPQFGPMAPGGPVPPAPTAMPTPLPWPGAQPVQPSRKNPDEKE